MGWFAAKLIFETTSAQGDDDDPICEESIRVLRAVSVLEAREKAEVLGKRSEHSYKNDRGEVVVWRFLQIDEIQDLCEDELEDGTEVFSTMRFMNL